MAGHRAWPRCCPGAWLRCRPRLRPRRSIVAPSTSAGKTRRRRRRSGSEIPGRSRGAELYPAFERQEVGPARRSTFAPSRTVGRTGGAGRRGLAAANPGRARRGIRYVHALINEAPAGASLPHSHSQLVWMRSAAGRVRREQRPAGRAARAGRAKRDRARRCSRSRPPCRRGTLREPTPTAPWPSGSRYSASSSRGYASSKARSPGTPAPCARSRNTCTSCRA